MQILTLKTLRGDRGTMKRGTKATVPDAYGKALVNRRLAEELPGGKKPKRASRASKKEPSNAAS